MQKLFSSLNAKKLNTDSTFSNAGQQDNKDLERMGLMKSMVRIVEMLEKMEARSWTQHCCLFIMILSTFPT